MYSCKSKSISIRAMQRELKVLGQKSCGALRRPLISEAFFLPPNKKDE